MERRKGLLVGLGVLVFLVGAKAPVDLNESVRVSVLEGILTHRPAGLFRCILQTDGGQICVLRPARQIQEDRLRDIESGTRLRVEGRLDSDYYDASKEPGPAAEPSTWIIFMQVKDLRVLEKPPVLPPAAPLPKEGS